MRFLHFPVLYFWRVYFPMGRRHSVNHYHYLPGLVKSRDRKSLDKSRLRKSFQVEGVLHKISETDLQKIVNTEGENYQLTNLLVRTGKSRRKACTLIYITEEPKDIPPSRRYMKILVNAAKKSNLSYGYIRNLEKRPFVYYPILSEIMSLRVYLWVWLRT